MVRKRTQWSVAVVLVCVFAGACWSQLAERLMTPNSCSGKSSCSDCIRTAGCHWCSAPDHSRPRCFQPDLNDDKGYCSEEYITNSGNMLSIYRSRSLTRGKGGGRIGWGSEESVSMSETNSYEASGSVSGGGAAGGAFGAAEDLIQIQPQRVRLQLRLNEMQPLRFAYSQAQDYPVDLYYLMDLSASMENDKDNLILLGDLLSETMRNITSNFRLGFGSFVDKLVMPYVSTIPKDLQSPCKKCAAPYGFINAMSLDTNSKYFTNAVRNAKVSGNLDAPEGGFDAIMQAIVCKSQIGWRDQARHLLVFSTDAGFHFAGDGKLGGIVQPNDGLCHLDEKGTYTHSKLQDYPSVSHINVKSNDDDAISGPPRPGTLGLYTAFPYGKYKTEYKVKEQSINLIFAVTSSQIDVYEELTKRIEGSSCGKLSSDSSNVVDLVRDQYNKISSTVEMKSNASKAINIIYKSACLGTEGDLMVTNKCDGLKVGDVVHFTAEITLKECPKDPKEWKQTFKIHPVGVSDSLIVELEMLCDCPCEHPGHYLYQDTSDVCGRNGVMACGVCLCDAGHFGKNCECSAANITLPEMERGCRPQNSATGPLCSNRGTCDCGVCHCNKLDGGKKISGPYCECDNFSCDLKKGQMCSGPDHGQCVCGKCVCDPKYTGPACDCLLDDTPCTCPGRCAEFKDCVLCEVHERGPMLQDDISQAKCGNCSLHPIIEEGKLEANETIGEHLCSFYDDEDCLYTYVYVYDEARQLRVRAQRERECPPKVFILGIVLGVIAAIVLMGMALLMVWKMVTTIHDRREYAHFEKERMMAKWDTGENPIFKQATTTFKNPTYTGN
ncbi:Integrin beta-PS [Eumeta japonica]|uniref:Integrin beta n=1 Tax=Eumeta variegata TaxID=151549 RepID=A0A4C1TC03_EUMVA|nr:Integrin beta-PS [Eumeta japonica]